MNLAAVHSLERELSLLLINSGKYLGKIYFTTKILFLGARYSILKEVYLLFPMHPYSGYFLRVMAFGKVFQFLALCFGLSAAPQVFTRVMAPVRSFLHSLGFGFGLICTTGSFRHPPESRFLSLRTFLWLCNSLGVVVDWEMSQLVPQVLLDSLSFRASPAR